MVNVEPKRRLVIVLGILLLISVVVVVMIFYFTNLMKVSKMHFFVLYYGGLIDENNPSIKTAETQKIILAKPEMIILNKYFLNGSLNLTPEVNDEFHNAKIKIIAYVSTNNTARKLDVVIKEIDKQFSNSKIDGVFIDEVSDLTKDSDFDYYSSIYKHVKTNFGLDKVVIMNPGQTVSERIMQISDIVSFEENWAYSKNMTWKLHYPSNRFMGISSDEYCGQNHYKEEFCINNAIEAANATTTAWNYGIGYHFTTYRYTEIPDWFSDYVLKLNQAKQKVQFPFML
jgi:spherulation-specific family 4 protein